MGKDDVRNDFGQREQSYKLYEKKHFINGGTLYVMDPIDKQSGDYNDIFTIGRLFAERGEQVQILGKIHYKNAAYQMYFGELTETTYYKKCPDIKIGNKFYEYEGYDGSWNKKKVGRMLSHGAKQSQHIIIKNKNGCTDRFIVKCIHDRLRDHKFNHEIHEVWVYEKGGIRLVYKKQ